MTDQLGRAVVLLSGGLDSGVAMALWLADRGSVALALSADYGQRAAARELAAARALAARYGVPWQMVDLRWLAEPSRRAGSGLMPGAELPRTTAAAPGDQQTAAAVWVPARNVVLLAVAASYGEALGADWLVAGFNREEAATFPDNSAGFVAAFDRVLEFGCRRRLGVASPTLALDKPQIVAAARRLGLTAHDFWSCYDGGAAPCGHCESCVRSARAWLA